MTFLVTFIQIDGEGCNLKAFYCLLKRAPVQGNCKATQIQRIPSFLSAGMILRGEVRPVHMSSSQDESPAVTGSEKNLFFCHNTACYSTREAHIICPFTLFQEAGLVLEHNLWGHHPPAESLLISNPSHMAECDSRHWMNLLYHLQVCILLSKHDALIKEKSLDERSVS